MSIMDHKAMWQPGNPKIKSFQDTLHNYVTNSYTHENANELFKQFAIFNSEWENSPDNREDEVEKFLLTADGQKELRNGLKIVNPRYANYGDSKNGTWQDTTLKFIPEIEKTMADRKNNKPKDFEINLSVSDI